MLIEELCSKAQYETRLKKWGYRKYASKDLWKVIFYILALRQSQGKQSEVYLHGELLTEDKIKKEWKRYQSNGRALGSLPGTLRRQPREIRP